MNRHQRYSNVTPILSVLIGGAINVAGQNFDHSPNAARMDPDPNVVVEPEGAAEGGVGYAWTVELTGDDEAYITGHVGAWSWEDDSLFDAGAGEGSVGWTHTSNWVYVNLLEDTTLRVRHERNRNVPWPSAEDPNRMASIQTMRPSFTLFDGYDGEGPDKHTYNNDGDVAWADALTYIGHVNNSTHWACEAVYELPAGAYTIALGSNAPSNDTDRQGYRTVLETNAAGFAPTLSAQISGNGLTFFWRKGLDGYALQSRSSADGGGWTSEIDISPTVVEHTVPLVDELRIFRLAQPTP